MAVIHLTTFIQAPATRIFDLSRSINLHKIGLSHTGEEAVAGTTNGLIRLHETVTWQAKHLFKTRRFTAKITAMESPDMFIDEMLHGDFKSFSHEHHFKQIENGTIMIDLVRFESPYGVLGEWFNQLYLTGYMKNSFFNATM